MKRYIIVVLSLLFLGTVSAQTLYDGVEFSNKSLNGTARFVGMGGAMGALGGDISTIGTNPAGIGIYRSNDVMTSFSFTSHEIETKYDGNKFANNRNRGNLDNFGIVFSNNMGKYNALRFLNFAFNYSRAKTFYKTREMNGIMDGSQVDQMINQANDMYDFGYDLLTLSDGENNLFSMDHIGWLGAIGYEGWLFDAADDEGFGPIWDGLPDGYFYSKEWGGINQYDFNISFNFIDRIYLGLTIGAYDLNYKKYSYYGENLFYAGDTETKEGYDLHSQKWIDGAGFDFKFGIIARPFEDSPFRLGLSFHTPTYYKLTLGAKSYLSSILNGVDDKGNPASIESMVSAPNEFGERMETDFKLNTPWKLNFSLGHTIGTKLALGAEYEYQDNSNIKFKKPDWYGGSMEFENTVAKEYLKGVHTFRLGAEYNVIPEFAFRVGYNLSTSSYENNAAKVLAADALETDTDYANSEELHRITLGVGYRGRSFYADLGYQYNHYKEDFYAFEHIDLVPAKSTHSRSQVLMTLGFRF